MDEDIPPPPTPPPGFRESWSNPPPASVPPAPGAPPDADREQQQHTESAASQQLGAYDTPAPVAVFSTNGPNRSNASPHYVKPDPHLLFALVSTFCCFFPFGIPALVNCALVYSRIKSGDYDAALVASKWVVRWGAAAMIVGIVGAIVLALIIGNSEG